MNDHPVPQNVTTFEFHLVGDMTLKQFGFLGSGLAIAFGAYMLLMPINAFIAVPLILISAASGAAFAFMPLYDRPLEHWVKAFFAAIYTPTQGFWQIPITKKGIKPPTIDPNNPLVKNRLQHYLALLNLGSTSELPNILPIQPSPPPKPFPSLKRLDQSKIIPKPSTPSSPTLKAWVAPTPVEENKLPTAEELDKLINMAKQAQSLQIKVTEIEKQINQLKGALDASRSQPQTQGPSPKNTPNPNYTQHFQQMVNDLQGLVKQTENLHQQSQIATPVAPKFKPSHIVVVEPPKQTRTQLLLTSSPNVINGIVTDTTGNYLEGVIVIIHNKEGIPVRALKTNKLGQFAGATPLPSGVYTIILEKDSLEFDTLQITLSNTVLPPIAIQAKRGGVTG